MACPPQLTGLSFNSIVMFYVSLFHFTRLPKFSCFFFKSAYNRKILGCCIPLMLFSLYFQPSTAFLVLCRCLFIFHTSICLHSHWLKWQLQPVIKARLSTTLFTALVTAASELKFIIVGDNKEHKFFSRVNKKWHIVSFLFGKNANKIGYVYFLCKVLPKFTSKLQLSELPQTTC